MGLFPENMDILINQINCKNIFSGWSRHATCRHVARVPVTIPPPTGMESPKCSSLLTSVTACHWLAQVSGLPSSDIGLVGPRYCRLSHSKIQYKYCQLTLNIFALYTVYARYFYGGWSGVMLTRRRSCRGPLPLLPRVRPLASAGWSDPTIVLSNFNIDVH